MSCPTKTFMRFSTMLIARRETNSGMLIFVFACWLGLCCGESFSQSSYVDNELMDMRNELDMMLVDTLRDQAEAEPMLMHSYVPLGIDNREELRLIGVNLNKMFDYGAGVSRWYSTSTWDKVYLLGVREVPGLTAYTVQKNQLKETGPAMAESGSTELPSKVSAATMFQWWNTTSRRIEIISVVAVDTPDAELKWFRFDEKEQLVEFWSWPQHKPVSHLSVINSDQSIKLVIVNSPPSNAINSYIITLAEPKPDLWLSQIMYFEAPIRSVSINFVGDLIYLFVPLAELDKISVFKFDAPVTLLSHFRFHENITSEGVKEVTSFQTAYQSYLAVAGSKSAIYRVKRNGVVRNGTNECVSELKIELGPVDKWIPIEVATYRNDVILLAQKADSRKINFLSWHGTEEGFTRFQLCEDVAADPVVEEEICHVESWEGWTNFLLGRSNSSVPNLLVPHSDGSSKLFYFSTSLAPSEDPVQWEMSKLTERQNLIQNAWDEQKQKILKYDGKMNRSVFKINEKLKTINSNIERVKSNMENQDQDDLKKAILKFGNVKGSVTVKGKTLMLSAEVRHKLSGIAVHKLLNNTFRLDRPQKIKGIKMVAEMDTGSLSFKQIKGISSNSLIYMDEEIEMNGDVEFPYDLHVSGDITLPQSGRIDGIDFSDDLLLIDKHYTAPLTFEEIAVQYVSAQNANGTRLPSKAESRNGSEESVTREIVSGGNNLTVLNLNGVSWNDITDSVIWMNRDQHVPGTTTVTGKITAEGAMLVDNFNLIERRGADTNAGGEVDSSNHQSTAVPHQIPSEEELNRPESSPRATDCGSEKTVRCSDIKKPLLGGNQKPITSNDQHLHGDVVFTGEVKVGGLLRTVQKNTQDWASRIGDIVLKSEFGPVLFASKTFLHELDVQGNVQASELVNGHNVSDFMTSDTRQKITGPVTFMDHVTFKDIEIEGDWDGVNVTKLYENAVTLSEDQILPHLHLQSSGSRGITTASLTVTEENSAPPVTKKFARSDSEIDVVQSSFDIQNVGFKEIEILGDLVVEKMIAGENFTDFLYRRLSLTNENNVTANYDIEEMKVGHHLSVESMNGDPISKIARKLQDSKGMRQMDAIVEIEDLHVQGNITTRNGIAGFNIGKIAESAIGLYKNNVVGGELVFEDEITCEMLDVHGYISGRNLTSFYLDAVKREERAIISGKKVFKSSINVESDLNLDSLNRNKLSDYLTKGSDQLVKSKVIINGSVAGRGPELNLSVKGRFNGANLTDIIARYDYSNEGKHLWKGNVSFIEPVTIRNLSVDGFLNNVNFTHFIDTVYLDDKDNLFNGKQTFNANVIIQEDLFIKENFNDINLGDFFKNIVFKDGKSDVNKDIVFENTVVFNRDLLVHGRFDTDMLDGCNVDEWKRNAIFLDSSRRKAFNVTGVKTFKNVSASGNVKTDFIDGMDLNADSVISLSNDQSIHHPLVFSNVTVLNDVEVGNLVNGFRLEDELKNTLLVDYDQVIRSSCLINGSVNVRGDLSTASAVNNKLLQNAVIVDKNQNFSGPFTFDCVKTDLLDPKSNIVSGVDVVNWKAKAVLRDGDQVMDGEWHVEGELAFEERLKGSGLLNGLNVSWMDERLGLWKRDQMTLQSQIAENYAHDCKDLDVLVKKSNRRLYALQYFEILHSIDFESEISSAHAFKIESDNFVAVSSASGCMLTLYKWYGRSGRMKKFFDQNFASPVEVWATVSVNGVPHLITQSSKETELPSRCPYGTSSLWTFTGPSTKFQHVLDLSDIGKVLGTDDSMSVIYTYKEDSNQIVKWIVTKDEFSGSVSLKRMHSWRQEHFGVSQTAGHFTFELNFFTRLTNKKTMKKFIRQLWKTPTTQSEFSLHPKKKFVAVAALDFPELESRTDFVMIYRYSGQLYEKLPTLRPTALEWLEISQQVWLAFIENGTTLQVYHLLDEKVGFVNNLSVHLPSNNLVPMSLPVATKWNPTPALLTYAGSKLSIIVAKMAGDVYEGPAPDCSVEKGTGTN